MRFLVILFASLFSFSVQAATFEKMVIFGDSLSDTGNIYALTNHTLPINPPYYQGRFSNGPVWTEHLANALQINTDLKNQFADYAYAGAWASDNIPNDALATVNLTWEIEEYLDQASTSNSNEHTLFVIWIGANDYLNGLKGRSDTNAEAATNEAINSIKKNIDLLIQKGARHLLILNLPNLGLTPGATQLGPEFSRNLTNLAQLHNQKMAAMLVKEQLDHPNTHILALDVMPHFNDMMNQPNKYHLTNLKDPCYYGGYSSLEEDNSSLKLCTNPNEYVYWDHVHPSETIHVILAGVVSEFLKGIKV